MRRLGVFVGQGAQRPGMAEAFLHNTLFADSVKRCAEAYTAHGGSFDLAEAMPTCEGVDDTLRAQPLLCALQISASTALRASGQTLLHTAGHSLGEVAAAQHAGVLTTDEAFGIIRHRAETLQAVEGEMAVVLCPADRAYAVLRDAGLSSAVSVAASNDARSTTICGASLVEARQAFKSQRVVAKAVPVRYAFHSPLITQGMVDSLEAKLRTVLTRAPEEVEAQAGGGCTFHPTGLLTEAELCGGGVGAAAEAYVSRLGVLGGGLRCGYSASYWAQQIRNPVAFHTALGAIAAGPTPPEGAVEISPAPTLHRAISAHFPVEQLAL